MNTSAHQLSSVFAVLRPDLRIALVEKSPAVYESLDRDFDEFRGHVLIAEHVFEEDWPTWERHPAGDEIVVLLEGRATLVLKEGGVDRDVRLDESGAYVVIPAGTWHSARVSERCRMIFITPGQGTENVSEP